VTTTWDAESVLAAANAWVWVPDGAQQQRTDGYSVVAPPPFIPLPVMVRVFGSEAEPAELIEDVSAVARGWGRDQLSWRLSDFTRPFGLEAELLRRGAWVEEHVHVLALPLTEELPDFGVPDDVVVRRVADEETVRDLLVVSNDAFHEPPPTPELVEHSLAELQAGLKDDSGGRVIAYLNDRPASTGGWTLDGEVCRLWGGATHSELRGRGAYRAVLTERLRLARAAGATLALTFGRVATASPILTTLGFRRYGDERFVLLNLT
jgi:GNAT superfamily N-acetyltransferase